MKIQSQILSLLFLIGIILVEGCDQQVLIRTKSEKEIERDYELDSLIITFNGKEKDGITASSTNINFRDHFIKDIGNISGSIEEIETITPTWYDIFNGANINIIYYEGYSNKRKDYALGKLSNLLNNKWYTEKVSFSYIERVSDK